MGNETGVYFGRFGGGSTFLGIKDFSGPNPDLDWHLFLEKFGRCKHVRGKVVELYWGPDREVANATMLVALKLREIKES